MPRTNANAQTIVSANPATGEELGRVPITPASDLDSIVAEATAAQKRWGATGVRDRAAVIGRAAAYVRDHHAEIAELITKENGKTLAESYLMEVVPVIDTFMFVSRYAGRYLAPERVPTPQLFLKHKRHTLNRSPIGVIGVISPWNYPFTIPAGEVAIALASGNAVILKPAPLTPLIGEWIERAFDAAGLPVGLLTVLHGDAEIGSAMCAHPGIGKIFFTGSVEVGRLVASACGPLLKPYVLELGGKDAAIVCADADLDRAARGVLWGGAANCGQTCAGIERVYVAREVWDPFIDRISALAEKVTPGDPLDPATQIGPFADPQQFDTVDGQVNDALDHGAKRLTGGPADVGMPGKWYAPAVVTGVDHSMSLMTEETFGPVIPLMPFGDEREALTLANDSEYGLGASVWSRDPKRATRLARGLEAGSVWINDHMYSHAAAQLPWGGVKKSGVGVTHSRQGFIECSNTKLIAVDSGRIPVAWWHPYDERLRAGFTAMIDALYSPGASRKVRALAGHRPEWRGLVQRVREMGRGAL
jgi:succinate-semialdehyde dehydrogenase/glutarate-semialdehyde dehydrogenase